MRAAPTVRSCNKQSRAAGQNYTAAGLHERAASACDDSKMLSPRGVTHACTRAAASWRAASLGRVGDILKTRVPLPVAVLATLILASVAACMGAAYQSNSASCGRVAHGSATAVSAAARRVDVPAPAPLAPSPQPAMGFSLASTTRQPPLSAFAVALLLPPGEYNSSVTRRDAPQLAALCNLPIVAEILLVHESDAVLRNAEAAWIKNCRVRVRSKVARVADDAAAIAVAATSVRADAVFIVSAMANSSITPEDVGFGFYAWASTGGANLAGFTPLSVRVATVDALGSDPLPHFHALSASGGLFARRAHLQLIANAALATVPESTRARVAHCADAWLNTAFYKYFRAPPMYISSISRTAPSVPIVPTDDSCWEAVRSLIMFVAPLPPSQLTVVPFAALARAPHVTTTNAPVAASSSISHVPSAASAPSTVPQAKRLTSLTAMLAPAVQWNHAEVAPRGVVYVVGLKSPGVAAYTTRFKDGKADYFGELLLSLQSLRRVYNNSMPVAVITDSPDDVPREVRTLVDHVISKPVSPKEHGDKALGMTYTPFKSTVFMDADTQVCAPFDGLFTLIEANEWTMALEPTTRQEAGAIVEREAWNLVHYNSGVIGYRRTEGVLRLLHMWFDMHTHGNDQTTLVLLRQLLPLPVDTLQLPTRYHYRTHSGVAPQGIVGPVSIVHSRYFRNVSWVDNKHLVSCEALNHVTAPRLHDFNGLLTTLEAGHIATEGRLGVRGR